MTLEAVQPVIGTPSLVDIGRVAHFTDTYLPRRDGVVASLHTLLEALGAQGCAGLTVAPRHPDQPDRDGLMTVASVPCGVAHLRLGTWPRTPHIERVAAWGPQLIHVHTPGPVGLLGVLTARRLGLPLVHTYHTDLHAYAEAYKVPIKALKVLYRCYARRLNVQATPLRGASRGDVLDAANRLLLGDADAIIVPTPAVLGRATLPVAFQNIWWVPAAARTLPAPAQAVADFRARHGLRGKVILFVGRVNREKGIELLIPAFARVPGAQLVLIGAVYERRWLNRLLTRHGVADRVVVTGQLPPHQVAAAYGCADVFAFPSLTDTQGLVLQEAALAGVPSVLADPALHATGALGDATMLADATPNAFGAALAALLDDPGRRRELGQRARERALAHTPERYADRMREVYGRAAATALARSREVLCPGVPHLER